MRNFSRTLFGVSVSLAIAAGFFIASAVSAWTGAPANPPSSNAAAPINTSASGQTKTGDLGILGNVGVGTYTPWTKLTVVGSLGGNFGIVPSYTAWGLYGLGDGGAAIYNDNGSYKTLMIVGNNSAGGTREVGIWDNLTVASKITAPQYCIGASCIAAWPGASSWTTSGANIYNNNAGNVGINTSAPSTNLEVRGAQNIYSTANLTTAASARQLTIGESSNNSAYRTAIGYYIEGGTTWTGVLQATAGAAGTNLVLNPIGGNVGIGNTAPGYKLQVTGSAYANNIFANNSGLIGSANWADVNAGNIAVGNALYSYGKICAGNAAGDCSGAGGVVISPASIKFPDGTTQTTAAGAGSYINNQYASAQSANSWVSGTQTANLLTANTIKATSGSGGYAGLFQGNGANAGYLAWYKPDGVTRMGYMGWDPTNVTLTLESGAAFVVGNGNMLVGGAVDANNRFSSNGSNAGFQAVDRTTSGSAYFYRMAGINRLWDSVIGDVITYNGSGNVGIGTAGPIAKLNTAGVGGASNLWMQLNNSDFNGSTVGSGINFRPGAAAGDTYSIVQAFKSGSSAADLALNGFGGNVGIGTVGPAQKLDVYGNVALFGKNAIQGTDTWLRLNQDHAFTSGVHTPWNMNVAGLTVGPLYYDPGVGNITASGNVAAAAFFYNSDRRLKTAIQPLTGNLTKVLALQPVSYFWKNPATSKDPQIGFIAQDVKTIVPELVHTDASTTLESVDYARVAPLLVGSVQELNKKIDDQQNEIDMLKKEIGEMKTQMK